MARKTGHDVFRSIASIAKPTTQQHTNMKSGERDVEAHKVGGHADAMLYKVLGACDDSLV